MSPRKSSEKKKKYKAVSYQLIDLDSPIGQQLNTMVSQIIVDNHPELTNARIALAWNRSWGPDVDGRVTLGKCKKVSDLEKELAPYDFVIILREEFVTHERVTDLQRRALLDHELCHAAIKLDKDLEPVEDERGRQVWRIRKHDLEEFAEVVKRYGCYKRDLEEFAHALFDGMQDNPKAA